MMKLCLGKSIWKLDSGKPGKSITIIAGMSGSETPTISALMKLEDMIEINSGSICMIIANPSAARKKKAFIERDLTHAFTEVPIGSTEEDMRARDIMSYLDESDILLTIAQSSGRSYITTTHREWSDFFDTPAVLMGLEGIQPHRCESYMHRQDKVAISWYRNIHEQDTFKKQLTNFLCATGNISKIPPTTHLQTTHYHLDMTLRAPSTSFQFVKNWKHLEKIQAGEAIASHGKVTIRAPYTGVIAFPKLPTHIGDEMCVFGKAIDE